MKVKSFIAIFTSAFFISSCALLNQPGTADDDVYFSNSSNTKKNATIIPTIDIEKIKRDFPSQVDPNKPSGYNDNGTANPNAVLGYPAYNAQQDSLYKINPELSAAYQPYKMPPFSLREQYLLAKAERRQQRRLARINNRNNYNSFGYYNNYNNNFGYNYGYNDGFFNNGFGYNNGWGYSGFGPAINFGWNSFGGWNTGIGFGCNSFGYNPFYNPYFYNNFYNPYYTPWGYSNFYNPYGYYNYYPNYNNGGNYHETPNTNPPQSKPRQVIGSNLPANNGGTIDNPNPNPLRTIERSSGSEVPLKNIEQPNQVRSSGNTGTLINTPNGVQYIAPRNADAAPATYSTYDRSLEDSKRQTEYRNANPQYANPAPVETPKAWRNDEQQSNYQVPVQSQPNNNYQNTQQRSSQPTYNPPVYNPSPTYNTPRSSGGGGFGGGGSSSGGGGGRSSGGGGGGGVSRPR